MLIITDHFKDRYPHTIIGVSIVKNIDNLGALVLDDVKSQLTAKLIEKYKNDSKQELKNRHPIKEYVDYYDAFKKTYHVLHQLESIGLSYIKEKKSLVL